MSPLGDCRVFEIGIPRHPTTRGSPQLLSSRTQTQVCLVTMSQKRHMQYRGAMCIGIGYRTECSTRLTEECYLHKIMP